jgi:ubiquinone/menaquinone biosynthesis C-methylase UbiE
MRKNFFMLLTILLVLSGGTFAGILNGQDEHSHERKYTEEERAYLEKINAEYDLEWGKWRDRLFDIKVEPGMVIGEIGAGRGELAVLMAKRVGPEGHVYANEIDTKRIEDIRNLCEEEKVKNLTTILGEVQNPLFPEGVVDLVVMVEVLHHIQDPLPILAATLERIKSGASMIVIEPDINQEGGKKGGCYIDPGETRKLFERAGFLFESERRRIIVDLEFFIMNFKSPVSRSE